MPEFQWNWHHRLLCDRLDRFARGQIRRLMIFMPPRHSKSQLVSRHLPAQLLGNNPDANIIACSYAASLAKRMSRDVQRIMEQREYQSVFPDSVLPAKGVDGSKGHVRTNEFFELVGRRGSYRAAGVGGGITGMGFNFGIIDDPVKNREQADSPARRDAVWEWYTSTFYTRRAPGAGILITTTRWNPDDLAGRILAAAEADGNAEGWEVLRLPALADDALHPDDPRQPGEALWPDFYPVEDLERVRAQSAYDWSSMYQQDPRPEGGTEWGDSYFPDSIWFDDYPDNIRLKILALDPSKGRDAKHGDYAAFVFLSADPRGTVWVEADLRRGQPAEALIDQAVEHCRRFGPDKFVVEANMFQELLAAQIRKKGRRAGVPLPVEPVVNKVNKLVRIRRLGPFLADGVFRFKADPGTRLLVKQLRDFSIGEFDDGPDALEFGMRILIAMLNNRRKVPPPRRLGV